MLGLRVQKSQYTTPSTATFFLGGGAAAAARVKSTKKSCKITHQYLVVKLERDVDAIDGSMSVCVYAFIGSIVSPKLIFLSVA